jgi:osmotically-inducible protein OsmY
MVNSDGDIEAKHSGAAGADHRTRLLASDEERPDDQIRDHLTHALQQRSELHNCTIRECANGKASMVQEAHDDWPSGEIEIDASQGVVNLRGKVISLSHKRVIEALAWRTPGCRGVDNRLQVVPAEEDNDDELTDAIRLVMEMDRIAHADQISIQSEGGVVTLQGVLPRDEERRLAEMDAWAVWGVKDVRNQIQVRMQ